MMRSDAAVFHRRIEHFLDDRVKPMDFIDKQDIALLQIGEQRGKIAGLGDDRAGSGAKADTEFPRDDLGEGGLAQAGGAEE